MRGKQLLVEAKKWGASRETLENLFVVLEEEGDWVVGPSKKTPLGLLKAYGLDDEEFLTDYDVPKSLTDPAEIIEYLIRTNWSWGEFLGGVIASLAYFSKEDQDFIRPTLEKAIDKAERHGVDH